MIKRCVKLDKSFRHYQFSASTGLTVRLPFPRESRHILCLLIAAYVLSLIITHAGNNTVTEAI